MFLRAEAASIGHFRRAIDPIAQIDIRQTHFAGADEVVEDHHGAQTAAGLVDVIERIDHRQAILEHIDDLEDYFLAEARARKNRKTISLEEVERELGLAD